MGREVVIEAPPTRVVSCASSNTEIIAALGLIDRLVGVDDFSDYPPEIVERREAGVLESVGGVTNLSVEKVAELKPDLVLINAGLQGNFTSILEEAGLTVIALDAERVQDIYQSIKLVAKVMDVEEKAERLIENLRAQVDSI